MSCPQMRAVFGFGNKQKPSDLPVGRFVKNSGIFFRNLLKKKREAKWNKGWFISYIVYPLAVFLAGA